MERENYGLYGHAGNVWNWGNSCCCGSGVGAESQNPIIASFFRNIGYAEQLGSGVRNLYKYSKYYSGKEPEFVEGDVFRITVPLNEEFLEEWQKKQSDIYPTQDFD